MSVHKANFTEDNLPQRLAADAAAAAVAAALVTPVVTIMDRLRPVRIVVEMSCSNRPFSDFLLTHLRCALKAPGRFALSRPCLLVFGLYFGTFGIANSTTTISDTQFFRPDPTMAKTITVFATLSVNIPLGIHKDTVFSRLFVCATLPIQTPSKVPLTPRTPFSTYSAFLLRDVITIYTSFALPSTVSSYVSDTAFSHPQAKAAVAQLAVPALGQAINTPVHLIGLEIYNRQGGVKLPEMIDFVRRNFVSAALVRIGRIIPAFGLGTLSNNELRGELNRMIK
ncbi:uncharacterized protein N7458_012818 [Penicillium daleae]|uniref:Uncharacterized protein n=1 Tax=Penicillium daleae TaxID=63821 RepID=A0AAD6BYF9_9EURO|nr:uncharacterized protein N7458_012818 [Penicillium daleae]KAJ5433662.1 hypothetical protein N7458_012818 [Penicillium daleae]